MSDEMYNEAPINAVENDSSANISTELVTFRQYGAYNAKGEPVGVNDNGEPDDKSKPSITRQTRDGKNWAKQEERKATLLNENAIKWYTVKSLQGFTDLVPDPEQQIYIITKGLDQLQTAGANALMNARVENDSNAFANNGETLDLREYINRPPDRKFLSDEEKLAKTVSALDPAKALEMLQALAAQLQAKTSTTEG